MQKASITPEDAASIQRRMVDAALVVAESHGSPIKLSDEQYTQLRTALHRAIGAALLTVTEETL